MVCIHISVFHAHRNPFLCHILDIYVSLCHARKSCFWNIVCTDLSVFDVHIFYGYEAC